MKLVDNWRKVLKTYSFLSLVANILVALSVTGLSVLGVLSSQVAFSTLAVSASVLGLFGVLGRFIDQSYDDMEDK